jgi:hypothetical protein
MSRPLRDRPLWLLDIDGVVNALMRGPLPDVWPEQEWVQRLVITEIPDRGAMTLPILAARPVLDFVAEVHLSGRAEVRWHSTWRAAAITAFAPTLGLPTSIPISVAPEWTDRPIAQWWKLGAAERAAAGGRALVWTDDDLRIYRDDAARLSADHTLLIGPHSETGLGPDDLERIDRFLRRA